MPVQLLAYASRIMVLRPKRIVALFFISECVSCVLPLKPSLLLVRKKYLCKAIWFKLFYRKRSSVQSKLFTFYGVHTTSIKPMTLMSSVCIKFSYATLAPPMLGPYLDEKVCVITTDGCMFVGILEGYDRSTNIILHKTEERIIRPEGTTIRDLGTFILRGVTVATIGLIDQEIDGQIEWDIVRAPKLDTTKHPN